MKDYFLLIWDMFKSFWLISLGVFLGIFIIFSPILLIIFLIHIIYILGG